MDEKTLGFDEKLALLLAEAKKKRNVLENREVLNFFAGEILAVLSSQFANTPARA